MSYIDLVAALTPAVRIQVQDHRRNGITSMSRENFVQTFRVPRELYFAGPSPSVMRRALNDAIVGANCTTFIN